MKQSQKPSCFGMPDYVEVAQPERCNEYECPHDCFVKCYAEYSKRNNIKQCASCRNGGHTNYDDDVCLSMARDPDTKKISLRANLCKTHRDILEEDGYDVMILERVVTMTKIKQKDKPPVESRIIDILKRVVPIEQLNCAGCCKNLHTFSVGFYHVDCGGWIIGENERAWVYIVCPHCGYQTALHHVGIEHGRELI